MAIYNVQLIPPEEDAIDLTEIVAADSVRIKKQLHKDGKPVIDEAKVTLFPEIANDDEHAVDTEYIIEHIKKHATLSISRDGELLFTGRLKFDPKVSLFPIPKVELTAMCQLSLLKDQNVEGEGDSNEVIIINRTDVEFPSEGASLDAFEGAALDVYLTYILRCICPSLMSSEDADSPLQIRTHSTNKIKFAYGYVEPQGNVLNTLEDFMLAMKCSLTSDPDGRTLWVDLLPILESNDEIHNLDEIEKCEILADTSLSLRGSPKDGIQLKPLAWSDRGVVTPAHHYFTIKHNEDEYDEWEPISYKYKILDEHEDIKAEIYGSRDIHDGEGHEGNPYRLMIRVRFTVKEKLLGNCEKWFSVEKGDTITQSFRSEMGSKLTISVRMTNNNRCDFRVYDYEGRQGIDDKREVWIVVHSPLVGLWEYEENIAPYVHDATNTKKVEMPVCFPVINDDLKDYSIDLQKYLYTILIKEQEEVSFNSFERYELGRVARLKVISPGILEAELKAIRIIKVEEAAEGGHAKFKYTASIISEIEVSEAPEPVVTVRTLPLTTDLTHAVDSLGEAISAVSSQVAGSLGASAESLESPADTSFYEDIEDAEDTESYRDFSYLTLSTISPGLISLDTETGEGAQASIDAEDGSSASRAIVATQYAADVFVYWGQRFIAQSNYKIYYDVQVTTPALYNFTRTNEAGETERGLWFSPSPSSNLNEQITKEEYIARYRALEDAILNSEDEDIVFYDGRPLSYEVLKENNKQNYMRTSEHNFNDTHRYLEYVVEDAQESPEGEESSVEATNGDIPSPTAGAPEEDSSQEDRTPVEEEAPEGSDTANEETPPTTAGAPEDAQESPEGEEPPVDTTNEETPLTTAGAPEDEEGEEDRTSVEEEAPEGSDTTDDSTEEGITKSTDGADAGDSPVEDQDSEVEEEITEDADPVDEENPEDSSPITEESTDDTDSTSEEGESQEAAEESSQEVNTVAHPKRWIYRVRAVAYGSYRPLRIRQLTETELEAYDEGLRTAIVNDGGFDAGNQASWITRTQIWGLSQWSDTLLPDTLPDDWWNTSVPATCCVEVQPFDGGDIQAGTITASQIKAGSIEGYNIKADSIDAEHLKADAIEAVHIKTGSITAGDIFGDQMTSRNWADTTDESGELVYGEGSSFDLDNGAVHWKEVVFDDLVPIEYVRFGIFTEFVRKTIIRHTKIGPSHGLEVYDSIEYHLSTAQVDNNIPLPDDAGTIIEYHRIPLTIEANNTDGRTFWGPHAGAYFGHLYGFSRGAIGEVLIQQGDLGCALLFTRDGRGYFPTPSAVYVDYFGNDSMRAIYVRVKAVVEALHQNEIGLPPARGFLRLEIEYYDPDIHGNYSLSYDLASDGGLIVYGSGERPTLKVSNNLVIPVRRLNPFKVRARILIYALSDDTVDYTKFVYFLEITQLGFFN